MGDLDNAIPCFKIALNGHRAQLGEVHPEVGKDYNNLGLAYADGGALDEAIDCFKNAMKIYDVVYGNSHFEIGTTLNSLGQLFKEKGLKVCQGMFRKIITD